MTHAPRRRLLTGFALALPALLLASGALSAPKAAPASAKSQASAKTQLVALATAFVPMSLEIGTYDDEYVDSYFGPAALKTAADARPRSKEALRTVAQDAVVKLERDILPKLSDPLDLARARALRDFYRAAATKLAMMAGEKLSFDQEAAGLFAVRPVLKPLSYYDAIIAKLDKLLPGAGPLAERVDAFNEQFVVPKDKLRPVMEAAIAECRRRTLAHFDLPTEESFDLEFVTGKSWSGYNYYKGKYHSLIQVNTDLPTRIGRAVDLGCHEGYPGHHVLNIMIERNLVGARGWTEYWISPLATPQNIISEGSANYGINLAFPGDEQFTFERDKLFPLAGLDPAQAKALWNVRKATEDLGGARMTVAKMYLDGKIDRAKAVQLLQTYQLTNAKRAEQGVAFIDHYRSYVINYHLGKDMVRDYVERGKPNEATRWARMKHVLSDAVMPADLLAP